MTKHSTISPEKKEAELEAVKKYLPLGWTSILSRMAVAANKEMEDWQRPLPTSTAQITSLVNNLRYEHPIWPLVQKLIDQRKPYVDKLHPATKKRPAEAKANHVNGNGEEVSTYCAS